MRFKGHPLRTSQIRRGNNSRTFYQSAELLRRAFERKPMVAGFQRDDRVHLSAHLENKVVSPLNFFRCVRKGEAVFANPVDVHVERLAPERFKVEGLRHLRTKSSENYQSWGKSKSASSVENTLSSSSRAGVTSSFSIFQTNQSAPFFVNRTLKFPPRR